MTEIIAKKYLGQHFLGSEEIAGQISKQVPAVGKVLEIGPGLGMLTSFLAGRCADLTAVEIDAELVKILQKKFKNSKNAVAIKQGDCLEEDYSAYATVCGLLPYNISSQIIEKLSRSKCKNGVFVIQRELGQRMVAGPGTADYSRFSVLCQNNFNCEIISTYPPEVFWPAPKVYSCLVKMARKKPLVIDQALVNALFQHKNQKVKKALLHSKHLLGEKTGKIAEKLGGLGEKRVVQLTLAELAKISN
jgi:16S rRNA (adenine1518-N6/adenine1519-N6)-dimethyltransferase